MLKHWIGVLLIGAAALVLAGCPQQPEVTPEEPAEVQQAREEAEQEVEEAEEQVEEAEEEVREQVPARMEVDPNRLPAPRPQLDDSPDLYGGHYVINDETLSRMGSDTVPAEVLDALRNELSGQEFNNSADFLAAVQDAAGSAADPYLETILRDALILDLADRPRPPTSTVESMAAADRPEEEEMAEQPESMPAPDFPNVYFDFDRSNIKPEFEDDIDTIARTLREREDVRIIVEGHADERGTNEYNLALGQRRAQSVYDALVAEGINPDRMLTVSYGEERPVCTESNEACWAKNRRGVIVLQ